MQPHMVADTVGVRARGQPHRLPAPLPAPLPVGMIGRKLGFRQDMLTGSGKDVLSHASSQLKLLLGSGRLLS